MALGDYKRGALGGMRSGARMKDITLRAAQTAADPANAGLTQGELDQQIASGVDPKDAYGLSHQLKQAQGQAALGMLEKQVGRRREDWGKVADAGVALATAKEGSPISAGLGALTG